MNSALNKLCYTQNPDKFVSVVTFTILLFTQRVHSVMEDKVHKQQDLIATDGEDPGFLIHSPQTPLSTHA